MLETAEGSMLATWRAGRWPAVLGDVLERIGEHRREYLAYEGEVAGGRGSVRRVEAGEIKVDPVDESRWMLTMAGIREMGLELQDAGPYWHVTFVVPAKA